MKTINPKELNPAQIQGYLQGAIGPRPIALASTIDKEGRPNLSPFSFFNLFSANPPIVVFSPARRVRDNTTKHTLENLQEVKEVVINIVTYDMVQQTSLSSTEYAEGVDEFVKSGFTKLPSELIKPYRVAESPVQLECQVREIVSLGNEGGAGNLVIAEIIKFHIDEKILNEDGTGIDQYKVDLVARMGGNWYSRAREGMFEVEKPLTTLGVGVDALPKHILKMNFFTGNELGILGNVEKLPTEQEMQTIATEVEGLSSDELLKQAREVLSKGNAKKAWKYILFVK